LFVNFPVYISIELVVVNDVPDEVKSVIEATAYYKRIAKKLIRKRTPIGTYGHYYYTYEEKE